ncbi:glycogen debranching protein [Leifsonia sp. ku-ls]|nr:glycogen debranching protein [Leifsonia sp. ku-ls]
MAEHAFTFDIAEIPFSRRGAWLDLSRVVGLHRTVDDIHLVTHTGGMHAVFRLLPVSAGAPAVAEVRATPSVLTWSVGDRTVEAAFEDGQALRFRGRGLGLRFAAGEELTPFTGGYLFTDPVDGSVTLTSYESGRRYRLTTLSGSPSVTGDQRLGRGERFVEFGDGDWEAVLEEIGTAAPPFVATRTFDALTRRRAAEFAEYSERLAGPEADATAVKAAYVMWSATVSPAGFVGREAVLMSKHWMDKVWSWDHCFNAIALAPADPDAALDQFLLPFDHQDASGALPDSVTHSEVLYNFVKPPIHGWAFAQLRARSPRAFGDHERRVVHDRLAAWTRFWLDHRRSPGHRLPYYQHGNDSGWDNSTVFDRGGVVEAPDLAAFLILQLRELVVLASGLGLPTAEWEAAQHDLTDALLGELWTGEGFVARSVATGAVSPSRSLLTAMPIVLGELLPDEIVDVLARQIEGHLTEWGPATEPVDSPEYQDDGYWRGPVWAPSTALIEDGLRRSGRNALADRVSERFRAVCARSGFAENFDARTGAGLRDRAYSWTASVHLALAADAERRAHSAATPAAALTGER